MDEELKEIMAIAMTIGAGKIKVIQESALASIPGNKAVDLEPKQEESAPAAEESCFT